ncbi:SDR family NAD(P)-dependent oxidoreductase [Alteromonas sp. ASW11-36]|uniref:Dihydromonapterin reductase n=1 Tax=Alteromonas arenosi TaxID=3055817 RepID=A0ABT7SZQ2_9ALTE|nr:SDR family NAD(P)-dependent oxidoreductase [Alteromonas sp. ASW11-36]MDM7861032.1 SDR family NAD(P)-dependent oxidoreductase [Alteromonas sp. ASW11-36]
MPHILISGAGRRFGLALVEHFVVQGYQVTAMTRESNLALQDLTHQFPAHINVIECIDYSPDSALQVLQDAGVKNVTVLINNASLFEADKDNQQDAQAQFMNMYKVHMALPATLSHWFAEQFNPAAFKEGVIINLTDIYADNPKPQHMYYSATKAGLENLTKSLAKQLAPAIRVNSIKPGAIKFLPEHSKGEQHAVLKNSLSGVEAGFAALLKTVDYILDNAFVSGTAITVDGGRSIVL